MAIVEETVSRVTRAPREWAWPPAWALIRRDFIGELRCHRSFALLALVVVVCSALLVVSWPSEHLSRPNRNVVFHVMYGLFAMALLTAAMVLPPGLAALAFASERTRETLDQLRLSLISPLGLAVSKLLSSVGLVGLILVSTLPLLGVQLFVQGVSTDEITGLIVMVLTTAFMGAAIGLVCGIYFRRSLVALVMSYVGTVFVLGGFLFVFLLLAALMYGLLGDETANRLFKTWVEGTAVFHFLEEAVEYAIFKPYPAISDGIDWSTKLMIVAGGYRVLVGLLCLAAVVWMLGRPPKPPRVPQGRPIDDPEELKRRRRRFPFYLVDPLRRRPPIPDGTNPIFAREFRESLGLRADSAIRIFLATAGTCGMIGLFVAWPTGSMRDYAAGLQVCLTCLAAITVLVVQLLAANVWTKEYEQGHLASLRMTLMTPRDLLFGKLAAAIAAAAPFLLGLIVSGIPLFAIVAFVGSGGVATFATGYAAVLTCAWFTLCLALCVSAHLRATVASLLVGMCLSGLVLFGPMVLAVLLGNLTSIEQAIWGAACVKVVTHLSPIPVYVLMQIQADAHSYSAYTTTAQAGLYVVFPAFIALGGGLLWLTYRRLVVLSTRDEQ